MRIPDEEVFDWKPDRSEPYNAVAIAVMIRLVIIGALLWWVFGKFSSDMHKLFQMGATFVLR